MNKIIPCIILILVVTIFTGCQSEQNNRLTPIGILMKDGTTQSVLYPQRLITAKSSNVSNQRYMLIPLGENDSILTGEGFEISDEDYGKTIRSINNDGLFFILSINKNTSEERINKIWSILDKREALIISRNW